MTFERLIEEVRQRLKEEHPEMLANMDAQCGTNGLRHVAYASVIAMGFHLDQRGEICDPRPPPSYPRSPNWKRRR